MIHFSDAKFFHLAVSGLLYVLVMPKMLYQTCGNVWILCFPAIQLISILCQKCNVQSLCFKSVL